MSPRNFFFSSKASTSKRTLIFFITIVLSAKQFHVFFRTSIGRPDCIVKVLKKKFLLFTMTLTISIRGDIVKDNECFSSICNSTKLVFGDADLGWDPLSKMQLRSLCCLWTNSFKYFYSLAELHKRAMYWPILSTVRDSFLTVHFYWPF